MNVSNAPSVNTVSNNPPQQPTAAAKPQPKEEQKESSVVKISEEAQQARRADEQKSSSNSEARARESRAQSDAYAARAAEASKYQATQTEARGQRVNAVA